MKLKMLLFILLLVYIRSYAQYKQLLHKPYKDKVTELIKLYDTIADSHADPKFVLDYTTEMKRWAFENNDKELAYEADLIRAYYYYCEYKSGERAVIHPKISKVIEEFTTIAQKAKKEGLINIEERAVYGIALTYWWEGRYYEKAFEWLLRSDKILGKMNQEDFPYMATHQNFIGRCYYFFKDYKIALQYYKKSSELIKTEFNSLAVIEAQNTVGLCYQELGDFERSNLWFLRIINDTSSYSNPVWKNIASGNLGYNYYLKGDYIKAIPLFQTDISGALEIKDYGLAAGSTIPLSDIYLQQHQLKKAKGKIDDALRYIQQSGQTDRLRKLYPIISKWYAANNESEMSMVYLDSAMASTKEYNEKYNSLQLLRANQTVEARDRELEVEKLKTESQLKISQRNYMIILIAIVLIGSLLIFWSRNKYLLKKQEIKDLELENTQKALSNAKDRLENLAQKVRKDNHMIIELKKIKATEIDQNLLSELRSKNILTQEDWAQFQNLFREAYPSFFPLLIASYPNLSQAEIRYLCLIKLHLTNNEMALVLGVSPSSMRVAKHRIINKLKIENQVEMETYIQELGNNN